MKLSRGTWAGLVLLFLSQAPLLWTIMHVFGRPPSWQAGLESRGYAGPCLPASEAAARLVDTAAQVQKSIIALSTVTGQLGERLANVEGEVKSIAVAKRIRIVQTKCEQAAKQTKETKADVKEVKEDVQQTKEAVQEIAPQSGLPAVPWYRVWEWHAPWQ